MAPARELGGIEVVAIASRDQRRATAYARKHGIRQVHTSYDDLLDDPQIDAVYIPTPAALHGRWATAALSAGKHVLVEKPFTVNAEEAERLAAAGTRSGLVLMEAYHTSYHPMYERLRQLVSDGGIGDVLSASASFCVPIPRRSDIRWDESLGGGSLLDVGYYPVRVLRDLLGSAPSVTFAEAKVSRGVDRSMSADLVFGGVSAHISSSIWSSRLIDVSLRIEGTAARVDVRSPYHPHMMGQLRVERAGVRSVENTDPRSTYSFQLEAFRDAIRDGAPIRTDGAAGVAQMQTLDAIYDAAGMEPRRQALP